MSPRPTGRLRKTEGGADLVLERTFTGSAQDVWRSITDPERTARWFGPWEGEGGVGKTVRLQMAFEEGMPWCDMRIEACEPPHRLALHMKDDHGVWNLDLTVTSTGETSTLTFVQRLTDPKEVEHTGPGWDYYLDNLVAAERGEPLPTFADYYPSQKAHYAAAASGLR